MITFREACKEDISAMHLVRLSVRENILSNPAHVTEEDYVRLITLDGKGWLCEIDKVIVAFGFIDRVKNNVWALFVHPDFEGKKIGSELLQLMLGWHFSECKETLWLSTDAGTRADHFYRAAGWKEVMRFAKNEVKFEMTYSDWQNMQDNHLNDSHS